MLLSSAGVLVDVAVVRELLRGAAASWVVCFQVRSSRPPLGYVAFKYARGGKWARRLLAFSLTPVGLRTGSFYVYGLMGLDLLCSGSASSMPWFGCCGKWCKPTLPKGSSRPRLFFIASRVFCSSPLFFWPSPFHGDEFDKFSSRPQAPWSGFRSSSRPPEDRSQRPADRPCYARAEVLQVGGGAHRARAGRRSRCISPRLPVSHLPLLCGLHSS